VPFFYKFCFRSSTASSLIDLSKLEETLSPMPLLEDFESKHLLVSALLNLADAADYLVAVKAMDALLIVCGLNDDRAARHAVEDTPLATYAGQRLATLYAAAPLASVDAAMIESVKVNWARAHHLLAAANSSREEEEPLPEFQGRSELVAFFSWLDYADDLCSCPMSIVAQAAADGVREHFLDAVLGPELLKEASTDEDAVRLLALMAQCWSHVKSEALAVEFSAWLLGDGNEPELRGIPGHPVRSTLLRLCKSSPPEVALEALSTLDVLLERPCEPVLRALCLATLSGRGYYDFNSSVEVSSWSDEEEEREKRRRSEEREEHSPSPHTGPSSRTMAPSNIARIVNGWLYLTPEELRTDEKPGCEGYAKGAELQVSQAFKACSGFSSWPREALSSSVEDNLSSDSRVEADRSFYEGDFMSCLFDLLETMDEREYDVNLQVTSILSRLCQLPHPHLHEYLLDNTLTLTPGTRSMHGCLSKAASRLKEKLSGDKDELRKKVNASRRALLAGGDAEERAKLLSFSAEEAKALDALIVLEEFVKEVAAIALVKYHLAS